MVDVHVTARDGALRLIEATAGTALMDCLRDAGAGVDGTCGGAMSCGSCHVYVAPDWAGKLPPKSEDEQAMLDAIGELVALRATSRLSCQIPVSEALAGLAVEIAPAL